MKNILVTGGMGFIGSHTCVELVHAGYQPIIIDNLENSKPWVKDRIEKIVSRSIIFYHGDCRDAKYLAHIFNTHAIDGIIHFAAHKAVGESVEKPLKYYDNNLNGLITLLDIAQKHGCHRMVFSSSCTVYGTPNALPVDENAPIQAAESPYGTTKIMCEQIIRDLTLAAQKDAYQAVLLRYFNPIGAHESALIGELPLGIPSNLVPFITQTAAGIRKSLTVFGNDYDTSDGSCIRDFIHVSDLAKAHVKALDYLFEQRESICESINVGTGAGNSVLELIRTFEEVTGQKLKYIIGSRRAGDVVEIYADAKKAHKLLGWKAEFGIKKALQDAWRWQKTLA